MTLFEQRQSQKRLTCVYIYICTYLNFVVSVCFHRTRVVDDLVRHVSHGPIWECPRRDIPNLECVGEMERRSRSHKELFPGIEGWRPLGASGRSRGIEILWSLSGIGADCVLFWWCMMLFITSSTMKRHEEAISCQKVGLGIPT